MWCMSVMMPHSVIIMVSKQNHSNQTHLLGLLDSTVLKKHIWRFASGPTMAAFFRVLFIYSVKVAIEGVCGQSCVTRDGGVRGDAERPELNTTPC